MKKDQTFIRSLKGWISGNAGLQEERELHQLAQDDPFLADALDGYQSTAGEDHEQHLQNLRKRLVRKEEKRRGREGMGEEEKWEKNDNRERRDNDSK